MLVFKKTNRNSTTIRFQKKKKKKFFFLRPTVYPYASIDR